MAHEHFSREVLKAQDGKRVNLTLENGGPVIGEAVLRFEETTGNLELDAWIDHLELDVWIDNKADG